MKKILFIPVIALLFFGLVTFVAQADSSHPLAQKFMEKFNLDQEEVENLIDEHREERHQLMEEKYKDRLNKAVENGKITEEQKQMLIEKHEEFQKEMVNLSWEEKKEKRGEMREWMKESGINCPGQPFNGLEGRRGGRMMMK